MNPASDATGGGGDTSLVRRRVVVRGRVQGVGFRASCVRRARGAGVGGWVRNSSDGSVEAVFEGEAGAVQSVVEWCRHGPPWAKVEAVAVTDEEPGGESGFRVR